jgi:hypothetical protein
VLFARLMSGYGRDASLNAKERKAPGTVSITQLPGSPTASRSSVFGSEAVDGEQQQGMMSAAAAPAVLSLCDAAGGEVSSALMPVFVPHHRLLEAVLQLFRCLYSSHCSCSNHSLHWHDIGLTVCTSTFADDPGTPYSRRSDKSSSEPGDVELIERNMDSSAYGKQWNIWSSVLMQ